MPDNLCRTWATDKLLFALFKALPVGVCITDEEGCFIYVNDAYCRIYGYHSEELVGESFLTVVPEEHHDLLAQLHNDFIFGNTEEVPAIWEVLRKDGIRITISATARQFQDDDGKRYKITTVTDISETIRLKKLREDAERIVRHDLKSPLNGVLGGVQLLRETMPAADGDTEEENRLYLDAIEESGRQMLYLINQSMDWFAMEEGSYQITPMEFDAVRFLTMLKSQFDHMARRKKLHIVLMFDSAEAGPDTCCPLKGEKRLLESMLANLLKNALEASPEGETVVVSCTTGPMTCFSVRNVGVVPPAIRPTIFDRYVTMNKKYGNGLGLYSARLIARAHGGDIHFTSSEAEGTTFTACYPEPSG